MRKSHFESDLRPLLRSGLSKASIGSQQDIIEDIDRKNERLDEESPPIPLPPSAVFAFIWRVL